MIIRNERALATDIIKDIKDRNNIIASFSFIIYRLRPKNKEILGNRKRGNMNKKYKLISNNY